MCRSEAELLNSWYANWGPQGVELANILCTSSGPGSASLANSWQNTYGLTMHVWGDTTDYMYTNFCGPIGGGSYPNTMVIELDTMTLTTFEVGQVAMVENKIQQILANADPCAEI